MKRNIIQSALFALALVLAANLSLAATEKTPAAAPAKPAGKAVASDKDAKAKKAKAAAKVKFVDINSAGKAELKKLPRVGEAEADKIIAGRPYLSKANLVTHKVLPREIYDGIKAMVVAKQNAATEAKLKEKQKAR